MVYLPPLTRLQNSDFSAPGNKTQCRVALARRSKRNEECNDRIKWFKLAASLDKTRADDLATSSKVYRNSILPSPFETWHDWKKRQVNQAAGQPKIQSVQS